MSYNPLQEAVGRAGFECQTCNLIVLVLLWLRAWPRNLMSWACWMISFSSNTPINSVTRSSSPINSGPSSVRMNAKDTTSFLVNSSIFDLAWEIANRRAAVLLDMVAINWAIVNNLIPLYFLVRTIFTLTFFQIFAAKQLTEHKRAGQPLLSQNHFQFSWSLFWTFKIEKWKVKVVLIFFKTGKVNFFFE